MTYYQGMPPLRDRKLETPELDEQLDLLKTPLLEEEEHDEDNNDNV